MSQPKFMESRRSTPKHRAKLAAVSELHIACYSGDVGAVQRLLADGATVSARDAFVLTPLHYAARAGHATVARLLLGAGADMRARDDEAWTPAHDAARYGQADVLKLLLATGADANPGDHAGSTPLDVARLWNQPEAIAVLEQWHAMRSPRAFGTEPAVEPNAATLIEADPALNARVSWSDAAATIEVRGAVNDVGNGLRGWVRRCANPNVAVEDAENGLRWCSEPKVDASLQQLAALLGTGPATVRSLATSGVATLEQAREPMSLLAFTRYCHYEYCMVYGI